MIILWWIVRLRVDASAVPAPHLHGIASSGDACLCEAPACPPFYSSNMSFIATYVYRMKFLAGAEAEMGLNMIEY